MSQAFATYALWMLVLSAAGTAISLWVLYLVIKAAVRDGMLEAQRQQRPAPQRATMPAGEGPDFRATR